MRRDLNTAFARVLVDEWARAGMTEACLAPGSRSTPMALALATDARFRVHVHLDERSAAFFALGAAKASGRPAVVLCTSGTAAAELHPAVLEARHGRVPLLVCTADRPPELRDTGAPQTADQVKLYGGAVRWFAHSGPPEDRPEALASWRPLACRAAAETLGPPAGPVHLNLAFAEPLVPTGADMPEIPGRAGSQPWVRTSPARPVPSSEDVHRLVRSVAAADRGLLVAGWGAGVAADVVERFAAAAGWPVLADPLSGLRCGPCVVSSYEALLRVGAFAAARRPDLVVRIGGPLTSRVVAEWLDASVPQVLIDPDRVWLDPRRTAGERLVADAALLLDAVAQRLPTPRRPTWLQDWQRAAVVAREAIDACLDGWSDPFEGRVARDLVAGLPDQATLVVGSSMPVRDLEAFAPPRRGLRIAANRGLNGIDGFVSTALGIAAVSPGPVVALCGDLTFLHDGGGLLGVSRRGLDAVFVVVDNDGGGIFSFLPQAALCEHFETLFGTPHGIDLAGLAAVHGVPTIDVAEADALMPAVEKGIAAGGVHLVRARTDRTENVNRHRRVWDAVARAVTAAGLA